jgi:hypothetical protein
MKEILFNLLISLLGNDLLMIEGFDINKSLYMINDKFSRLR